MKYLIIYMSHHGTTRKVVEEMKKLLGSEETTIVDLATESVPDFSDYHTILIGGSIYGGQIQKKIKKFCQDNEERLLSKRVGLFFCSMVKEKNQLAYNDAFSEKLRKHALARGFFGGELIFEKMNFFERIMTQFTSGKTENVYALDDNSIKAFGQAIIR